MQKLLISLHFWIFLLFCIYISLFFFRQTNLAASDLGRHVKNGEVILTTGKIFHTNLYSYTFPDFTAPNHHWLFGVISYLTYQMSGFDGITVLCALLYIGAIIIILIYSWRKTSFYPVVTATLLALPLLTDRVETRPEAFSLFFFSLLYCLFGWLLTHKKFAYTYIFAAVSFVVLALWINIHIFFVLSGVLVAAAIVHAFVIKRYGSIKQILIISASCIAGAFINPLGLKLIFYPLEIFNNYGYRVSENQSLLFFLGAYTRPIHWYIVFFICVTIVLYLMYLKKSFKETLYYALVTVFFLLFTAKLIRIENIFAISAIPLLSFALEKFRTSNGQQLIKKMKQTSIMMVVSFVGFLIACVGLGTGLFFPFAYGIGTGLTPGYDTTIQFVKSLKLSGPIFNNFDDGSFLIYSLYPQNKVFVDNRAEAYPADFLKNVYVKAQEDEPTWLQLEKQYGFTSIIFYRNEQTNWGQEFLIKRIQDETWVPIYVDNYLILFLKDIPENQATIEKYRLPKEMFSIKQG